MILDYTAIDIETTGINSKNDRITELGAVRVRNGKVVGKFSELVNPGRKLPPYIVKITGITDEMLADKRSIEQVLPEFIEFCGDDILLGHNIMFDYGFIKQNAINMHMNWEKQGIDTLKISRKFLQDLESRKLDYLCEYYGIKDDNHHRAYNDAAVTSELYKVLLEQFGKEFPEAFAPAALVFSVKKQSPITEKQKKYLNSLLTYHNLTIEENIDSLTKSEASRIIDKILSEKGRIYV